MGEKQQMLKEMNSKKVQILLSTYNGEKYLNDLLKSLLTQTYKNINILIRDDGSIDNTIEILKEYSKQDNIKVVLGENLGAKNSFFELIKIADENYDYYSFCDQDDIWIDEKTEKAIKLLENENKDIPLLYFSNKTVVDESLNLIGYVSNPRRELSLENAIVENLVSGCTIVINRRTRESLLDRFPKYTSMHDNWMYKVVSAFGKVIYDKNSYILYRQHSNNVSGVEINFIKSWKSKIFISKSKRAIVREKRVHVLVQVKEFYDIFYERLSDSQRKFLEDFINKPNTIFKRVIYVLKAKWYRQKIFDDLIFKILVIFRR